MELILLLVIVVAALVLFVGGWLRADVVGLLALSALALLGLVSPKEALSGFSSSAVVTVAAMFVLSAGLTRTGVAHQIGRPLLALAHGGEALLVGALTLAAAVLSALINTTTVAVILLPAAVDLARRSGLPPSRLLLPLAMGAVLGGPFTGISTPPNILATEALAAAGFQPFALLDFTPITGAIVVVGTIFLVLAGRHLLPRRSVGGEKQARSSYQMETHIFTIRIPEGSLLAGRTLAESRLGSALSLTVLALNRKGSLILAPRAQNVLQADDELVVHGQPKHVQRYQGRQHLEVEAQAGLVDLVDGQLRVREGRVPEGSLLVGLTLGESELRREHKVQVLSLSTSAGEEVRHPVSHRFAAGERLVVQGELEALERLGQLGLVADLADLADDHRHALLARKGRLLAVRVPEGSVLANRDLVESRLGNAFGLTVVSIVRDDRTVPMPAPSERLLAGDLLVLRGSARDLEVLEGLQDLEIRGQTPGLMAELESQQVGITEVLLSPRTGLAGRTLAELLFRDQYGLSVLAIWRRGQAFRTGLQDMPLQFGDALLVYGQRSGLQALARNSDFLVLDRAAAQAPRLERAVLAAALMLATILSAMLGLVPIAIAGITGATLMVLTGCITMEEAYQSIEWKVVFLIAAMLPLGMAVEHTGAAQMAAEGMIALVGDLGPRWVVAGLFLVTVIGTQVIPTAALVVLMAPVALTAAQSQGLSPHLLMMTVAISASSSYASPLSHPAHLLVMSPGGYRFMDYVKVGAPLTAISMALCVGLLPVLFPP